VTTAGPLTVRQMAMTKCEHNNEPEGSHPLLLQL
jgi:hypothetical protein